MRRGLAQPRDPARRLTLVDDALRRRLRNGAYGGGQLGLHLRGVAARERLAELPHLRAHRRGDGLVARAMPDRLPVLLLCGLGIRHVPRLQFTQKRSARIAPARRDCQSREHRGEKTPSTRCPPRENPRFLTVSCVRSIIGVYSYTTGKFAKLLAFPRP